MAIKFGRPLQHEIRFVPAEAEASESHAIRSTLPCACAATGAATGRAAWCASNVSPPTT